MKLTGRQCRRTLAVDSHATASLSWSFLNPKLPCWSYPSGFSSLPTSAGVLKVNGNSEKDVMGVFCLPGVDVVLAGIDEAGIIALFYFLGCSTRAIAHFNTWQSGPSFISR